MAFIRCDRGSGPTDHHTLAMLLSPEQGYVHSVREVADLDALAAGGSISPSAATPGRGDRPAYPGQRGL
jgi:hypothetical protein